MITETRKEVVKTMTGFGILEDCMLCGMTAEAILTWMKAHGVQAFIEYDSEFVGGVSEIVTAKDHYAVHFSIEFDCDTGLSDCSGWVIWD